MPYDPKFIARCNLQLPVLGTSVQPFAFNGGNPIEHTKFSILFHQGRGFAIACAHNIDGASIIKEGKIKRKSFVFDPDVPNRIQVADKQGYHKNPWDRGHLVRRRAVHWGKLAEATQADRESSYWTNIAPQHEHLHDTAWGSIEDWLLELADASDKRLCVFTGPVLLGQDPLLVNKPTEKPIQIPAGFWKIIALKHNSVLRAAAFLVWQRDYDSDKPVAFDPILEQVRITTIEFLTDLSFPDLKDADPLKFGITLKLVARRRRPIAGTAIRKPAAVTCRDDVVL